MSKKYIILEGVARVLEWYCNDRGRMPAKESWDGLTQDRQEKLTRLFRYMATLGALKNKEKFIHEGDGIYAFKTRDDRFFCFFFEGSKIIVTNAYEKQSDKMPPREKNKALAYREDYVKRVMTGRYYE